MTEPTTLYRKYRPKKFADFVGQKAIRAALQSAVAGNRFGQAYVFAGPRGVGKTSMARLLALALNCLSPKKDGEPCNKCSHCLALAAGSFLDLIEIDAASYGRIEAMRELTEKLHLAPAQGKYKIYIFDEAHGMSLPAFNAFLKTLEEPPSHVIFILATTEPHKLPPTVLSRCQRFDFGLLPVKEIADQLLKVAKAEKLDLKKEVLSLIAQQARGSLRDALSLLEQFSYFANLDEKSLRELMGLVGRHSLEQLLAHLLAGELKEALQLVNELYTQGSDPLRLIEAWANYLRTLIFIKLGAENLVLLTDDELKKSQEQAEKASLENLNALLRQALLAYERLKRSELPLLPLELMVMEGMELKPLPPRTDSRDREIPASERPPLNQGEDWQKNWHETIREIHQKKPSLAIILKQAQVTVEQSKLKIHFASRFYQQLLQRPLNHETLSEILVHHWGGEWEVVYDESRLKPPSITDDLSEKKTKAIMNRDEQLLEDARRIFGLPGE